MTHQNIENQLETYRQRLEEAILAGFNKNLENEIEQVTKIAIEIRSVLSSFTDNNPAHGSASENLIPYLTCNKKLVDLNHRYFKWQEQKKFSETHEEYIRLSRLLMDDIPGTVELVQSDDRFRRQPGDKRIVKLIKIPKRTIFFISRLPVRLMNFFRRIFKKETRPVTNWKYSLPLLKLCSFFFRYRIPLQLILHEEGCKKFISTSMLKLWELELKTLSTNSTDGEQNFDFKDPLDRIIFGLEEKKKIIRENTRKDIEEEFQKLKDLVPMAGTIEMPAWNFRPGKLRRKLRSFEKKYARIFSGWRNNIYALSEDWTLDIELEIYRLMFFVYGLRRRIPIRI